MYAYINSAAGFDVRHHQRDFHRPLWALLTQCNGSKWMDNIWVLLAGVLRTLQFLEKSPSRQQKRDNATNRMSKTFQWSFNCSFISPPTGTKRRRVNSAPAFGNCYLQVPTVRYCFSFSFSFFFSETLVRRLQMRSLPLRRAARQRSETKLVQTKTKCRPFWCQLPLACSCCCCCCNGCYPWQPCIFFPSSVGLWGGRGRFGGGC